MDCDGERHLCDDLVNATVIEHRLADYELQKICYRIVKVHGVDACMELNFTTGVCNIYFPRNPNRETRLHERNHCRGWAHKQARWGQEYQWFIMPEAIALQEPPAEPARKSYASADYDGRRSYPDGP